MNRSNRIPSMSYRDGEINENDNNIIITLWIAENLIFRGDDTIEQNISSLYCVVKFISILRTAFLVMNLDVFGPMFQFTVTGTIVRA